jgi:hypothetical protein
VSQDDKKTDAPKKMSAKSVEPDHKIGQMFCNSRETKKQKPDQK